MSDNNNLNDLPQIDPQIKADPVPAEPSGDAFVPDLPPTDYIPSTPVEPSPVPVTPAPAPVEISAPAPAAPVVDTVEEAIDAPAPVQAFAPVNSDGTSTAAAAPSKKQIKQEAKMRKKNDKALKQQGLKDQCPTVYKPVSTSRYFWLMFFLAIPVVGFILTIILSFAHRNRNIKAFVRAVLAWDIVAILLCLIGLLVATFFGYGDIVGKVAMAFGDFFETLATAINI